MCPEVTGVDDGATDGAEDGRVSSVFAVDDDEIGSEDCGLASEVVVVDVEKKEALVRRGGENVENVVLRG